MSGEFKKLFGTIEGNTNIGKLVKENPPRNNKENGKCKICTLWMIESANFALFVFSRGNFKCKYVNSTFLKCLEFL